MTIQVFVGSSSESKPIVEAILIALHDIGGIDPRAWYDHTVFIPGHSYLGCLHRLLDEIDAALIVFTGDDVTLSRQVESSSPRDNTVYEAGFFGAAFGYKSPERCALLVISEDQRPPPKLPSDIAGHHYIKVRPIRNADGKLDIQRTQSQIRIALQAEWIPALNRKIEGHRLTPSTVKTILDKVLALATDNHPRPHQRALDILDSAIRHSNWNNGGIDEKLITHLTRRIFKQENVVAMHAVDVLGPDGWMSPTTYRYLSIQLRHYVMRNVTKGKWNIRTSKALEKAITKSISAARERGLEESETKFDNPDNVTWCAGRRKLEYSRTLLWTREELLSPAGASVIDIHNAFNVPLFYLQAQPDDNIRRLDFIFFESNNGIIGGFYGDKNSSPPYRTEEFSENGVVFGHDPMETQYKRLLMSDNLMFAADAFKCFNKR